MSNRNWDRVLTNCQLATMVGPHNGLVRDGAIAIRDREIVWVGPRLNLPKKTHGEDEDLKGAWVTPGLIDCHTHLVFAGSRVGEFEARLKGETYEGIAGQGGGILSTVSRTREASEDQLFNASLPRALALRDSGVTTVEIKSGYGLDLENELKMLRVATRIGEATGMGVATTCLAAHAVPPEFAGRADDYINLVCDEILPAVAREGLAYALDAYCESIAFSALQVERLFAAGKALNLEVKLHADQLSDQGGAALAARAGALSADHLEFANQAGVDLMAANGTTAVLLPGAFQFLGQKQVPPLVGFRRSKIPIAVATDCNPGTSPLTSLLIAMHLACTHFSMAPDEVLTGVTRNAAGALGLSDRGVIAEGYRADLAVWDVDDPAELCYWAGNSPLRKLYLGGVAVQETLG